jgi:hypothetical protein
MLQIEKDITPTPETITTRMVQSRVQAKREM